WIFGCDVCQEVCPWNRFAPPARDARLHARALLDDWSLERFLELDEDGFTRLFAGSPIRRTRRAGFLRNVCVALGNRGDAASAPALARTLVQDPDSLVRGHAAWALGEIGARPEHPVDVTDSITAALTRAVDQDPSSKVVEECRLALGRARARAAR
ncbi:MAG TPA: HEAT repeat domain-containing protein, partial [Dongiaceae bacterium]|nr:HEAT repeat domain-containing protein [Dongiaceae bacterium]